MLISFVKASRMWKLKILFQLLSVCHYLQPWFTIFCHWGLLPATTRHFVRLRVLYFAIAGSIERILVFSFVGLTCPLTDEVLLSTFKVRR